MLAEEVPLGISYGGVAYAVMMGSPADLHDFAVGFTLTEGIAPPAALRGVAIKPGVEGAEIDIILQPERFQAFLGRQRVRSLRGHTSCGLCGVKDLAAMRMDLPPAPKGVPIHPTTLARSLAALRDWQPLSRQTNAAHAAAAVAPDGTIRLVREDVGRHTALDKLIGAAARAELALADGFVLITSRCSYEMVQKALMAGVASLVAISAPTALAVRTAQDAGLTLIASAGRAHPVCFAGPERWGE